eukprot:SAG31_NODE_24367_length_482_cov_0.682292_1_plen_101_part_01
MSLILHIRDATLAQVFGRKPEAAKNIEAELVPGLYSGNPDVTASSLATLSGLLAEVQPGPEESEDDLKYRQDCVKLNRKKVGEMGALRSIVSCLESPEIQQ